MAPERAGAPIPANVRTMTMSLSPEAAGSRGRSGRERVFRAPGAKHPAYAERRFGAPLEQLWPVASDLENELPLLVSGLRSFTVTQSAGERLSGEAVGTLGYKERFDVVLRPGWCLMQGKVLT